MWQVFDAMWDEAVVVFKNGTKETPSKNEAVVACAMMNQAADWFCNKPRYYTREKIGE